MSLPNWKICNLSTNHQEVLVNKVEGLIGYFIKCYSWGNVTQVIIQGVLVIFYIIYSVYQECASY